MTTITKYIVALILSLSVSGISAQEKVDSTTVKNSDTAYKIKLLDNQKELIIGREREGLKVRVTAINKKQDNNEITAAEADKLKKKAAKKTALNIENRIAVIDNKIEFLTRNNYVYDDGLERNINYIGVNGNDGFYSVGINLKSKNKPPKYDIRTTNQILFAIGFNNAISDGQGIGDIYEFAGSGFVELGWTWTTRLFKESNFARLNYGFAFQWNKLNVKDNQFFVQNGNQTTIEEFPVELKQSQLRITNLVFPMHFEFGPSKKRELDDRIRYSTNDKFKIGIGGYGGVRLATQQKLRYKDNGDRVKDKIRRNYNASNFVYGLSAYVGIGDVALYAKYDLNSLFKNQTVDQHNISLGLRVDLD
jgi:hypothetical protein